MLDVGCGVGRRMDDGGWILDDLTPDEAPLSGPFLQTPHVVLPKERRVKYKLVCCLQAPCDVDELRSEVVTADRKCVQVVASYT